MIYLTYSLSGFNGSDEKPHRIEWAVLKYIQHPITVYLSSSYGKEILLAIDEEATIDNNQKVLEDLKGLGFKLQGYTVYANVNGHVRPTGIFEFSKHAAIEAAETNTMTQPPCHGYWAELVELRDDGSFGIDDPIK